MKTFILLAMGLFAACASVEAPAHEMHYGYLIVEDRGGNINIVYCPQQDAAAEKVAECTVTYRVLDEKKR